MSKKPAAFRRSLPDYFLFWTFPNLIIRLCPKNQLLSEIHCLTTSYFGLFLTLDYPFMSKNPAAFRSSLPDSFLFWTFPDLICPFMSNKPAYNVRRKQEKRVHMSKTQPIRSTTQLNQFKKYYQEIIPEKRNYALIILGLNTALRISDILQLRVSDVWDWQKQSFKRHLEVMENKTGKQTSIYINKEVRQALLQCLLNQRAADEFIFASYKYKNMPLSRYQAYRIVKQAAVYAGMPEHINCHSLRKTFGYHAWKQSVPPAMLMDIYNHSSYQITRRYLGIDQDDKDQVFEKIRL